MMGFFNVVAACVCGYGYLQAVKRPEDFPTWYRPLMLFFVVTNLFLALI
jgi:hypothetical protein